jgi:hypothetical protein
LKNNKLFVLSVHSNISKIKLILETIVERVREGLKNFLSFVEFGRFSEVGTKSAYVFNFEYYIAFNF